MGLIEAVGWTILGIFIMFSLCVVVWFINGEIKNKNPLRELNKAAKGSKGRFYKVMVYEEFPNNKKEWPEIRESIPDNELEEFLYQHSHKGRKAIVGSSKAVSP